MYILSFMVDKRFLLQHMYFSSLFPSLLLMLLLSLSSSFYVVRYNQYGAICEKNISMGKECHYRALAIIWFPTS
ncbi:hypothetical protein BDP27DRAFT_1322186 [Rhodocollybia butyracea]|uniref:Uncharacterized protein n=1 Tax=Rhodocollybia butyracea TaxID=206335 RepID=A0A9P5PSG9_9AGAR|nr:hypothetical protein BDP27DRAFT_1322186 [Rhodocollybia butyracea]